MGQIASKLESHAQSGYVFDLLDEFIIKATEIPVGGATHATCSRANEEGLKNDCVNVINNKDEHCFLYALVMLMYRNHTRWNTISSGGKILKDLAKELAAKRDGEWDVPMSLGRITHVEKALHCSIRVFDIDNSPILDNTGCFKSSLIYFNDDRMKQWSTTGDGQNMSINFYSIRARVLWSTLTRSTVSLHC